MTKRGKKGPSRESQILLEPGTIGSLETVLQIQNP